MSLVCSRTSKYSTIANTPSLPDVGHGSGESLILQISHPEVPRPSRLTGITSLKTHHQRSSDRVARLQAFLVMTISLKSYSIMETQFSDQNYPSRVIHLTHPHKPQPIPPYSPSI